MAFKPRSSNGSKGSSDKAPAKWVQLGSICHGKQIDERTGKPKKYFQGTKYKARLLIQVVEDGSPESLEDGEIYAIKTANYFDAGEKDPEFIFKKLVVNLNSEYDVELLTQGSAPKKSSGYAAGTDPAKSKKPAPKRPVVQDDEDEDDTPF